VLRLGRNSGTFDVHETTHEQIVSAIIGAEYSEAPDEAA